MFPAVFLVELGIGDVRGRDLELVSHQDLNILGIKFGISNFFRAGIVDGQELNLDPVEGIGEQIPDGEHVGVALLEGPSDGVVVTIESGVP